ncbi:precorrin-6A synthase (deacetylating) [Actinomycetes bacterium KLBMP 9759]
MRAVYVIGIGSGDPDDLTVAAIAAMNRVDVFFTIDKGEVKSDLAALRTELLARHVTGTFRVVEAADPQRDRAAHRYVDAVGSWQGEREALYERMLTEELADGESGGFLVWGDPALYDGTLPILERIRARRPVFEIVSVPGISSVQALAAAHRLVLNRVGRAFTVTTGRRLAADGMPADVDDVVVMLDARTAFAELPDTDLDIFWGAYVGSSDEALLHGDLQAVKGTIKEVRAALRERKGWIMDTYLLRRRDPR